MERYFQMKFAFPIISQKYYSVHNQFSRWHLQRVKDSTQCPDLFATHSQTQKAATNNVYLHGFFFNSMFYKNMYFDRKRNVETEKKQMLDIFKIPLHIHLTAIIKRLGIVKLEMIYAFKCRKKTFKRKTRKVIKGRLRYTFSKGKRCFCSPRFSRLVTRLTIFSSCSSCLFCGHELAREGGAD